jgi:hypothetical protein
MDAERLRLVERLTKPATSSDLAHFFPIGSQTSPNDKLCLLGALRLIRQRGSYGYVEIGSFRGGSLTPFLMDPVCERILSVDDRGRIQPDERGVSYDYTAITTQTMLDELHRAGLPTDKLMTFDGSIHELENREGASFDLAFIDGEHTDEACFRDFIWTLPLMKADSIIMFHDSSLVYKSLKLIMLYLDKAGVEHAFFKRAESEMSLLMLGSRGTVELAEYLGPKQEASTFFAQSEAIRIKSQFRNRARFRFAPRKLLKLQVPLAVEIERPRSERM